MSPKLKDELREWLEQADARRELADSGDEQSVDADLDAREIEELRRLFADRMREQTERHDGGNYWIGTGGTSPFGQGGASQVGLTTGSSGGGRSAVHVADARNYRPYRSDVTLDIRQLEVALRRLRAFVRFFRRKFVHSRELCILHRWLVVDKNNFPLLKKFLVLRR